MPSPTTPSRERLAALTIEVAAAAPPTATAIGIPVATDGPSDAVAGLAFGRPALGSGRGVPRTPGVRRSSSQLPRGPTQIAVGIGAGARSTPRRCATPPPRSPAPPAPRRPRLRARRAGAVDAGVPPRRSSRASSSPATATTRCASDQGAARSRRSPSSPPCRRRRSPRAGAARGRIFAAVTALARDLANTPHSHLTASDLADIAVDLGARARPRRRGVRQGRARSSWAAAACSASTGAAPSRRGW